MKCQATKSSNQPCQANALRGGDYCFRHEKKAKKQALEASSEGGKANRQYHQLGKRVKLESPADIKRLMELAINSLWTGKMPSSNPAGSLGYLAKIFLEAHDKSEIELRIGALEEKLERLGRP